MLPCRRGIQLVYEPEWRIHVFGDAEVKDAMARQGNVIKVREEYLPEVAMREQRGARRSTAQIESGKQAPAQPKSA